MHISKTICDIREILVCLHEETEQGHSKIYQKRKSSHQARGFRY